MVSRFSTFIWLTVFAIYTTRPTNSQVTPAIWVDFNQIQSSGTWALSTSRTQTLSLTLGSGFSPNSAGLKKKNGVGVFECLPSNSARTTELFLASTGTGYTSFALEAVVRFQSVNTSPSGFIVGMDKNFGSGSVSGNAISYLNSNKFTVTGKNNNGFASPGVSGFVSSLSSVPAFNASRFYHVVVSQDASGSVVVYVDGAQYGAAFSAGASGTLTGSLSLLVCGDLVSAGASVDVFGFGYYKQSLTLQEVLLSCASAKALSRRYLADVICGDLTNPPTDAPSPNSTISPSMQPSETPTGVPTTIPSASPSTTPTKNPTMNPTTQPTPHTNYNVSVQFNSSATSQNFGKAVAISQDTLVIAFTNGSQGGAAHLYTRKRGSWMKQGIIRPFDREQNLNSQFGYSVAMTKTTLAIGAPTGNAVYIYEQQAIVTKINGSVRSLFGVDVSLSADTLAVGASNDGSKGSVSVYVKTQLEWQLQSKLTAFDGAINDSFGWSVTLDGNTLVVGAPNHNTHKGVNSGSVYVYERVHTSWSLSVKLIPLDLSANDFFGWKVFVKRRYLLVSAYGFSNGAGVAYVFMREKFGWREVSKITPKVPVNQFGFGGLFLDNSATKAIVGATKANAVFVFERNGASWNETEKIVGIGENGFGESLGVACGSIVVGVPGNNRAYLYSNINTVCAC